MTRPHPHPHQVECGLSSAARDSSARLKAILVAELDVALKSVNDAAPVKGVNDVAPSTSVPEAKACLASRYLVESTSATERFDPSTQRFDQMTERFDVRADRFDMSSVLPSVMPSGSSAAIPSTITHPAVTPFVTDAATTLCMPVAPYVASVPQTAVEGYDIRRCRATGKLTAPTSPCAYPHHTTNTHTNQNTRDARVCRLTGHIGIPTPSVCCRQAQDALHVL